MFSPGYLALALTQLWELSWSSLFLSLQLQILPFTLYKLSVQHGAQHTAGVQQVIEWIDGLTTTAMLNSLGFFLAIITFWTALRILSPGMVLLQLMPLCSADPFAWFGSHYCVFSSWNPSWLLMSLLCVPQTCFHSTWASTVLLFIT